MAAVTLTIDGRPATADAGETILDAVRRAGADVPTLCHLPGFPPPATCGVCAVEIAGREAVAYACATRAEEGQVVLTQSEKARAARRDAVELLLSDHPDACVAPCERACVVRLPVPAMVRALAEGDAAAALAALETRLKDPAPLGRSCRAPCESACVLGRSAAPDDGRKEGAEAPPSAPRAVPVKALHRAAAGDAPEGLDAAAEAARCLRCGCEAVDRCVLKRLADDMGARWDAYGRPPDGAFPPPDGTHPAFVHEPAKCVKCGRCVMAASRLGAGHGFAYHGRGFGLRVEGPLGAPAREALAEAGDACVDVCPTGALRRRARPVAAPPLR